MHKLTAPQERCDDRHVHRALRSGGRLTWPGRTGRGRAAAKVGMAVAGGNDVPPGSTLSATSTPYLPRPQAIVAPIRPGSAGCGGRGNKGGCARSFKSGHGRTAELYIYRILAADPLVDTD